MKWKQLTTEVLFKNKYWQYRFDTFERPDGSKGEYHIYEKNGNSAAIFPVREDGRVILVWQYRYTTDKMSLEVSAGAMDPGETIEESGRRECLEETGLEIGNFVQAGSFHLAPSRGPDRTEVFVVDVVGGDGVIRDTHEVEST